MSNGNPDFIFAQSMAAFQRGDLAKAIQHADRLLGLSDRSSAAIVWGVRLRIEAHKWQDAIDLGEGHHEVAGFLGHAYEGLGDLVRAQTFYQKATLNQPENPAWHYHNASCLSRLYRDFEAMEALRKAVEIAPDPAALLQLTSYELTFGKAEEALKLTQRADPKNPETHTLAAKALLALGREEEADIQWRQAISQAPKSQNVVLMRSIELIRQGSFEKGIQSLEEFAQNHARPTLAYCQIANAKKIQEEDRPLVEKMEVIATRKDLGEEERIGLHFALGKAHDNLKEYGAAITHFDRANDLQNRPIRESGGFDRAGYSRNMEFRKSVYPGGTPIEAANPSDMPIFVLGMIRSGTTLAEQILSSHPQVSGAGEQDFWINADVRLTDYGYNPLNVETLQRAADTYLRLLQRFAKPGDLRVVDKQPGNLILAGAIHLAFPNARIIYMTRHPADTAISIWTTHVRTSARFVNDKANIVYATREHEKLRQHWKGTVPGDRFLEVSYESLIDDREKATRKMLDFCGLNWSEQCLHPENNRKTVTTPSLWQVRQPVYRTSIDRWKNYESWLGEFRELL